MPVKILPKQAVNHIGPKVERARAKLKAVLKNPDSTPEEIYRVVEVYTEMIYLKDYFASALDNPRQAANSASNL